MDSWVAVFLPLFLRWTHCGKAILMAPIAAAVFLCSPSLVRAETLVVGLSENDYPPFYYVEEGQYRGAAYDIATALADQLGYELEFKRFPWARVQKLLSVGKIDMMILYIRSPEREEAAAFTTVPHIRERSALFEEKGRGTSFDGNVTSLKGMKLTNVRGYSHGAAYDGAQFLDKHEVSDEKTLIRLVTHGRRDLGVGNPPAIKFHAKRLGLADKVHFLEPMLDEAPNYFAFSRSRTDAEALAGKFSTAVEAFIKTPDYAGILKRYGFDTKSDLDNAAGS